jgi:hypothetical protein
MGAPLIPQYIYKMKAPLALLSAMLLSFAGVAQHRSSIQISAGPAIPVGDFGDKNIYSDKSGLAKTGQIVNISYHHLVTKNAGFAISIVGGRYPMDVHSLENSLSVMPGSGLVFATGLPGFPSTGVIVLKHYSWQGKKDAWLSGSLLAGPYFSFPLDTRISIDAQVQAGASYIQSPKIRLSTITDSSSAYLDQTDPHAIAFAYAVQGGPAYKVSPKISLVLNLQYFATARATFHNVKTTMTETTGAAGSLNYQITQSVHTGDGRQAVSAIGITADLRVHL